MNPKTQANLWEAMRGEAFAHAKYLLFAQQAHAPEKIRAQMHQRVEDFEREAQDER